MKITDSQMNEIVHTLADGIERALGVETTSELDRVDLNAELEELLNCRGIMVVEDPTIAGEPDREELIEALRLAVMAQLDVWAALGKAEKALGVDFELEPDIGRTAVKVNLSVTAADVTEFADDLIQQAKDATRDGPIDCDDLGNTRACPECGKACNWDSQEKHWVCPCGLCWKDE